MKRVINDQLCERVRLAELYPFELKNDLQSNGKQCAGMFIQKTGEIFINAIFKNNPERLIGTYLHEVGHLIAHKFKLDKSLDADAHNQYFAALVAVMYRRAGILHMLKIYDFCDTESGQRYLKDEPMLDDEALVERFQYVLRRSSALAKSRLTIEQIAKMLYIKDSLPHWHTGRFSASRAIYWPDIALGGAFGVSVVLGVSVAIALLLH